MDSTNNKIYVANGRSDTVSVIDGGSDTVEKTIPVGSNPTFVLITRNTTREGLGECCKIYVANSNSTAVSVIYGNDTEKRINNIYRPTFILSNGLKTYVASDIGYLYVIDAFTDTDPSPRDSIDLGSPALGQNNIMYINTNRTLMATPVIPGNDTQKAYSIILPLNDFNNFNYSQLNVTKIPFTLAEQITPFENIQEDIGMRFRVPRQHHV